MDTRSINIGGGTLLLPLGFDDNVLSWIDRGIVRFYGKGRT